MRAHGGSTVSIVLLAAGLLTSALGAAEGPPHGTPSLPPSTTIDLQADLVDRNPRGFAERLSKLLGVEVRLPVGGFGKLEVPAGEWTTVRLLNHVAKQIDGSWRLVYRLKTRIAGAPTAPVNPRLPPEGRITLTLPGVTYPRAVKLVQEAYPCVIELPDGFPPGRLQFAWKNEPMSRALEAFARIGGLRVVPAIVFELPDEAQANNLSRETDRLQEEAAQQAAVGQRLEDLYGLDPHGEEFPWENIDREGLSVSLGRELDLTPVEVDILIGRVRLEGLSRQEASPE